MKALVFFADGFEEIEGFGTVDILLRGGVEVCMVSVTDSVQVFGAHDICTVTDAFLEEIDVIKSCDAFILPGGGPGSIALNEHEGLRSVLVEQCDAGKLIAAICAAPRVLGSLGLLEGRRATCYPGIEPELTGANIVAEAVVVDGNIITARGPAAVFDFGLAILRYLQGDSIADQVAKDLLL
ncbi:MAG: DJ-1/PfpI family protein [Tannerella sp.]|jgi:4-methyl-5(b-hydroxyethyl)-thiazole monophosphate biosynthesis|nr:DJ-1/PfpI family protein [Tannerella sp.]